LVLGQEAVPDRSNELTAIPALLAQLALDGGLRGAPVSIDASATSGSIAAAINEAGAEYLLAVKATLHAEVEACFLAARPAAVQTHTEHDKGHSRIEQRRVSVIREVDWLSGAPLSRRTARARRGLHHPRRRPGRVRREAPRGDPILERFHADWK
jgi:predicted transposase YbfD/YdcC